MTLDSGNGGTKWNSRLPIKLAPKNEFEPSAKSWRFHSRPGTPATGIQSQQGTSSIDASAIYSSFPSAHHAFSFAPPTPLQRIRPAGCWVPDPSASSQVREGKT